MTATIQKWGNSRGIRLPKALLDGLNIAEGEEVEVISENNAIIIKPSVKRPAKRKSIQELFAGYEGGYEPQEIDWGEPAGGEIW